MSAFAAYATALPVHLVSACDALESKLASLEDPAPLVEELFAKALSRAASDDASVSLLRYYLTGASKNFLNASGEVDNEKAAVSELKMYAPLPQLILVSLLDKAKLYKANEKVTGEIEGVPVGKLEGVKWKLGGECIHSSCCCVSVCLCVCVSVRVCGACASSLG
jgi:hypothetical protein